jgi:hypothetical protein
MLAIFQSVFNFAFGYYRKFLIDSIFRFFQTDRSDYIAKVKLLKSLYSGFDIFFAYLTRCLAKLSHYGFFYNFKVMLVMHIFDLP